MGKTILFVCLNFLIGGFIFAQSPIAGLNKAREIKMLESSRNDVKRILVDYESDDYDYEDSTWYFSDENAEIKVTFASGDCADDDEYWNVAGGTAAKIEIIFENEIKVEDFKFDFSNFTKEVRNEDYPETSFYRKVKDDEFPEDYIYQNENLGIIFRISDNEIDKIILIPSKTNAASLCKNEKTERILAKEIRLIDSILRDGIGIDINPAANVEDLILSTDEIIIGCQDAAKNKACPNNNRKISVETIARDPDNDVLTYDYTISGGKIVGQGAKVVWDLSSVPPGTYTITAGVDDGCGICGQTKSKTVVVRECPDCKVKQ